MFLYYVIADIWLPVTPQARVYHPVVQISPQISGRVTKVLVSNNQPVKAGDILFEIDQSTYLLAVEQAKLTLDDAKLQNKRLDTNVKALEAQISAAKAKQHEQSLLKSRRTINKKNTITYKPSWERNQSFAGGDIFLDFG